MIYSLIDYGVPLAFWTLVFYGFRWLFANNIEQKKEDSNSTSREVNENENSTPSRNIKD